RHRASLRGAGGGRAAAALIAGIPAVASDWGPVARALSGRRRVIAYDNRGSGESTVTPGPYTTAQLAGDAAGLLDALGIDRADVFGMSMGGMIAQELAIGWPARVRKLVLGCTHAGIAHAARQPATAPGLSPCRPATGPTACARWRHSPSRAGWIRTRRATPRRSRRYSPTTASIGCRRSRPPTLIVTGDDDQIIPAASSDVLHERIPGSRLETVEGVGHLFFLERPEETLRLLESFL
ncbi:MAG: alpha/beta fold hydrolase, partial [Thermoleophilaceae bacterium]